MAGVAHMQVEHRLCCELCGSGSRVLHKDVVDHLFGVPGRWDFRMCSDPQCRMVWLDPRPMLDEIVGMYAEYHTHDTGDRTARSARMYASLRDSVAACALGYGEMTAHCSAGMRLTGKVLSLLRDLRDRFEGDFMWLDAAHRGHLLDVGCGNGEFLSLMRDHGWSVTGVEPDPRAAQIAREVYGLEIHVGGLPQEALSARSFDAITMNHVLEHLLDPDVVLRECWRLLKPHGQLVVVTPNTDSFGHAKYGMQWRGLEPPRHVSLYNPDSLRRRVERVGFTIGRAATTVRGAMYMLGLSDRMSRAARAGRSETLDQLMGSVKKHVHRLVALQLMSCWAIRQNPCTGEEVVVIAEKVDRGGCFGG